MGGRVRIVVSGNAAEHALGRRSALVMGIEGGAGTVQSLTMMRCERCRAVLSNADAPALIKAGTPCGVCGGVLTLAGARGRPRRAETQDPATPAAPSAPAS